MKIITYPNPILSQASQSINLETFDIKKLQKLSRKMIKTMYKADGIGLSAPQVNQSLRLCVIGQKSGNLPKDLILINPLIISHSLETVTMEEGCLSLPGVKVSVKRSIWIKVKAVDFDNRPFKFEAHDLFARVIQHEIDHLDGILIIDKSEFGI